MTSILLIDVEFSFELLWRTVFRIEINERLSSRDRRPAYVNPKANYNLLINDPAGRKVISCEWRMVYHSIRWICDDDAIAMFFRWDFVKRVVEAEFRQSESRQIISGNGTTDSINFMALPSTQRHCREVKANSTIVLRSEKYYLSLSIELDTPLKYCQYRACVAPDAKHKSNGSIIDFRTGSVSYLFWRATMDDGTHVVKVTPITNDPQNSY